MAADTDAYTRDTAATLIGLRRNGTGLRYHYLFDGLGSVIGLTDSGGQLINTYTYDPYDQTLNTAGTINNPWQYTAQWHDSTTGLYEIGHR